MAGFPITVHATLPFVVRITETPVFSDSAMTVPVAFPQTVSADTTWFVAARAHVTVTDPISGQTVIDQDVNPGVPSLSSVTSFDPSAYTLRDTY